MPHPVAFGRAALLGVLVLLGLVALPAAPAAAHPFGPPPTALLTATGDELRIEWRSAVDDAAAIGVTLGFLDEEILQAYLEAPTQVAPSAADEDAFTGSDELRDYLLTHVAVRQGDTDCRAAIGELRAFLYDGATITYRCPEPIAEVDVRISMLHDVHPAYRTFATAASATASPAQTVFTAADAQQRFDFAATGGGALGGSLTALVAVAVLGLLAAVGGGVALLRGRRPRPGIGPEHDRASREPAGATER